MPGLAPVDFKTLDTIRGRAAILRMGIRVIRTAARLAALTDAGTIRRNVASRPYTASNVFCFVLGLVVFPFRVFRPIQRKPVADKPRASNRPGVEL
jgi:hypothetical protein